MKTYLFALFLWACILRGTSLGDEITNAHGTLNLVLKTENCTIVASDSRLTMQTADKVEFQDNFRKLFPITDYVMVTVAGYYVVGVKGSAELTTSMSSIVEDYMNEVKAKKYTPPYEEVVISLINSIRFYLDTFSSINSTFEKFDDRPFESQVIFTGLDNGKIKVTKVILKCRQKPNGSLDYDIAKVEGLLEKQGLFYQAAGLIDVAVDIIGNPHNYIDSNEQGINEYIQQIKDGKVGTMSCENLLELSKAVFRLSERKYQEIGGPMHFSIFKSDKFEVNIPHDSKDIPLKSPFHFSLTQDIGVSNFKRNPIAFDLDKMILINVNNHYLNSVVQMDSSYFFNSTFNNCICELNSDKFYFATNNEPPRRRDGGVSQNKTRDHLYLEQF